jgi:CubicO group peptidase (beta-lactamase class C family)
MLHQTSGFRDFFALLYLAGRDDRDLSSPDQLLKLITRQKGLNNVPGAEFVYSNSNYFLLGLVVQRTTHKTLADFAAANIFNPLGMTHTLFYDNNKLVVPGRVAAYDAGDKGKFLVDWSTAFDIVGSGGLLSTVDDLLLWDRNFYANKLGKGPLLKALAAPGKLNNGKAINYTMGLWLGSYHGLPTVEHSGGTLGYRTELLRFPQQQFTVIELCNLESVDVEGLARKIADLYLQSDLRPAADGGIKPKSLPDPTSFAGQYYDSRTGIVYTFTAQKGNSWHGGRFCPGPVRLRSTILLAIPSRSMNRMG